MAWKYDMTSQSGVEACRFIFAYDQTKAVIYVDGPHHRNVPTKAVDDAKRHALRDAGYKVVVFKEELATWPSVFGQFPFIFGKGSA
jgi:very-short-patch-repair endonuclease